jgi:hypothetical protein
MTREKWEEALKSFHKENAILLVRNIEEYNRKKGNLFREKEQMEQACEECCYERTLSDKELWEKMAKDGR